MAIPIRVLPSTLALFCTIAALGVASGCTSPSQSSLTPGHEIATKYSAAHTADDAAASCASYTRQRLYIGTGFGGVIVVKAYQSAANAKVLCQIEPIQGEIGGLALDAKHNLWVSNESVPALSLYSHAANGTQVKPLQVISGDATLLLQVVDESLKGIGIDPLTGDVWVPNVHQSSGGAYLTAYASNANGNIAPLHTIGYADLGRSEELAAPVDIKFDSDGNMFVGDVHHVEIYQRPFTDTSKPVAIFVMQGQSFGWYLAFDPRGNLYASGQQRVTVFQGGLKSGGEIARTLICDSLSTLAFDPRSRFYSADGENTVNVSTPKPLDCTISRAITSKLLERAVPVAVAVGL